MKIVKPSVELIHCTPNPEKVIERFGRICYQSNHKVKVCPSCGGEKYAPHGIGGMYIKCDACNGTGTDISSAIEFVERIKKNQHESVLEHAVAGFSIVTDRGVSHELVRHRIASFSQESQRYNNYSKEQFDHELTFVNPFENNGIVDEVNTYCWKTEMESIEDTYLTMIKNGITPEIARSILPNCTKTEIGMTCNFREWRHFLKLRTDKKAHPQMRQIAEMIKEELLKVSAVCFNDI
jgi:thymidylate synthase (FAD)